ncbi:MAG: hypothetical protein AABY22_15825, partial [Nanoarchaeota archaeon]
MKQELVLSEKSIPKDLNISNVFNPFMEIQRQLDFQQTFDEGSSSSKQTSVFPNPFQRAEQVLLGSLLGDGSLRNLKKRKNTLYIENHSLKQKEYLLWKRDILDNFLKTKIREFSRINNKNNKE